MSLPHWLPNYYKLALCVVRKHYIEVVLTSYQPSLTLFSAYVHIVIPIINNTDITHIKCCNKRLVKSTEYNTYIFFTVDCMSAHNFIKKNRLLYLYILTRNVLTGSLYIT